MAQVKWGIIGLGKIGYAVAVRARCFGMQIHYHNRKPASEFIIAKLDATYWPCLNEMLAEVDFLSINCPQTPETHHLLDAERLGKLQKHAIVINSARGGIIDEAELAERLEKGEISLTDLSQSESSLAGAKAQLIAAQNDLVTSKSNFENIILRVKNPTRPIIPVIIKIVGTIGFFFAVYTTMVSLTPIKQIVKDIPTIDKR